MFHTHAGIVAHDSIIGRTEGVSVAGSTGRLFLVVRPTLSDVVLKMPRGAQVIYPKDLGAILLAADIGPGMRVLEAGVGSGALSMALLRAGADVVGYEVRPDFAAGARANVAAWSGAEVSYRVEERDVYDGIDEVDLDRIVLDLPEPWQVLGHAEKTLRPGGILLAYLPTINQVATLRAALTRSAFGMAETSEILRRTWHVEETIGPTRPPHGGSHRIPHHRPTSRPLRRGRRRRRRRARLALFDEDALPGTLFGRLGHGVLEILRHERHAGRTARVVLHGVGVLHVGETVVEQREDGRCDLLAQSVTGAQILVDPDLHDRFFRLSSPTDGATGR